MFLDITIETTEPIRIISRKEWNAQPPVDAIERLQLPVSRVIIAHTFTENCSTQVLDRVNFRVLIRAKSISELFLQ